MRDHDLETQAHILSGEWLCGEPGGALEGHGFILALLLLVTALQPLETDRDISVSSLAAHTGLLLRSPRERRRSWTILQVLCCRCR